MCSKVVSRLVSAVKARVARLETVVSNISLAKLIERVMQVEQPQVLPLLFSPRNDNHQQPLPDPSSVSAEDFRRLEREQAALKIQVTFTQRHSLQLGVLNFNSASVLPPQRASGMEQSDGHVSFQSPKSKTITKKPI